MKNLFILFLLVLGCSGSNEKATEEKTGDNIVIKSQEFKKVIKSFYKHALHYSPNSKNDTISVSFDQFESRDEVLNVRLYSFKKLEGKYIGETDLDNLKILFYADDVKTTEDFIELKYAKKVPINKQTDKKNNRPPTYKETYEKFYTYTNGKLRLVTLKQ